MKRRAVKASLDVAEEYRIRSMKSCQGSLYDSFMRKGWVLKGNKQETEGSKQMHE